MACPSLNAQPAITFDLPAQITQENASELLNAWSQKIQSTIKTAQSHTVFCFDAKQLQQFDSTALAVLLALRRQTHAENCQFRIVHLPQRLQDLAKVYGVEGLLKVNETNQANI